jgi:hypothetical protein
MFGVRKLMFKLAHLVAVLGAFPLQFLVVLNQLFVVLVRHLSETPRHCNSCVHFIGDLS